MSKTLLVLGARSDIGKAVADRFARAGFDLILAARRPNENEADKSDLEIRYGITAHLAEFDAGVFDTHANFYSSLPTEPDVVLYAVGYLGDQELGQNDHIEADRSIVANYSGAVSILSIVANDFEGKKSGSIIGISSVAGDKGRKSNYIYGSAKAGFTAFLSGLRHRLTETGVHVLTVKPGFVATKMTDGMDLPARLTTTPEKLAEAIFAAFESKKHVIYYLPIWRSIMSAIRNLPERIFVKTKF